MNNYEVTVNATNKRFSGVFTFDNIKATINKVCDAIDPFMSANDKLDLVDHLVEHGQALIIDGSESVTVKVFK